MPWADRLQEWVEDRTGYTLARSADVAAVQEAFTQVGQFIDEAEELAWQAHDAFGSSDMPREQRVEVRRRLIAQSRTALLRDPVAGAEAMHLTNFAFSRGVPMPQAKDEEVQKVLEEAWKDAVNKESLTGFDAQRKLSNDLLTSANLFCIGFEAEGRFRVGFKPPEQVIEIVTDPEDVERPLYYLCQKYERKWDFDNDQWSADQTTPKKLYYPHWQNVVAYEEEATERNEEVLRPPEEKLADGECFHVRINRVGTAQFGTPPWARTLRFYSGLNRLTEARVAMAQAAAAFIAKRITKGGPTAVQKAAQSVLRQAGDLAATMRSAYPGAEGGPAMQPPPRPASIFNENEAHTLQPLSLQSGGGSAQADVQIVRAPLSAASGFGQHYLGDASNANLATATALELPALMVVGAWQETFEQLFRWFCDRVIEVAVQSGRLGGNTREGTKKLSELRLAEQDDYDEAEKRTGKDLTYSFQMPYPGRRNLPDVIQAVTAVVQSFDSGLQNEVLLKQLLTFLFSQGFGEEDPSGLADEILNFQLPEPPPQPGMEPGGPGPGPLPRGRPALPADEQSVQGEKRRAQPPKDEMAEEISPAQVSEFIAEIERLWRENVPVEALIAAAVAADGNGHAPTP